jgi:hypothetical protein
MPKEIIQDFLSTIKLRINSPIISSIVIAWSIWNWDSLLLLFFGDPSFGNRVQFFKSSGSFWLNDLGPICVAFLYVLCMPILHRCIYQMHKDNNEEHHATWADLERAKQEKITALEKEKLKNNPDKPFLQQLVEIDISQERAKAEAEIIAKETLLLDKQQKELELEAAKQAVERESLEKQKASEALSEAQSKARIARQDLETIERTSSMKYELDKVKSERNRAIHNSQMMLLRTPILLQLTKSLDVNLREFGSSISIVGMFKTIAMVFGYRNEDELLSDRLFSSENFVQIKYISFDYSTLLREIEHILFEEQSSDLESDFIIKSLEMTFKHYDIRILDYESLAEFMTEELAENTDIFDSDSTNNAMAQTNAHFDDAPDLSVQSYEYDEHQNALVIDLEGSMSGSVDDDRVYSGHVLNLNVRVFFRPLFGKSAFSDYDLEVSAAVADYHEDEDQLDLFEGR